jgi:hypothetical protein
MLAGRGELGLFTTARGRNTRHDVSSIHARDGCRKAFGDTPGAIRCALMEVNDLARAALYLVRGSRVASASAIDGTMIHCSSGASPVPASGTTGISREYAQLCRTLVLNHSL